jgi:hypothetical protein
MELLPIGEHLNKRRFRLDTAQGPCYIPPRWKVPKALMPDVWLENALKRLLFSDRKWHLPA